MTATETPARNERRTGRCKTRARRDGHHAVKSERELAGAAHEALAATHLVGRAATRGIGPSTGRHQASRTVCD